MKIVENNIVLESEITCPECRLNQMETMPTDSCQFFYECSSCTTVLRPKAGDCCVFCSYGSVKCPSMQANELTATEGSSCHC